MHIHFEKSINIESDSWILSLSWMGKVPDELPEEEGWKLNRTNYYQEGWLSTGSMRGILGVTFTTTQWKDGQPPSRTNFNLRGHQRHITLVQWNEPYQKLASCDSSGIIFVWIKFEGRWSIELIKDRSSPVTHFSWSHDGRMALICYQDGFVLVGSVAGQRYWSSMLNLDSTITAGTWTPDDQQVYFGTSNGQLVVMDSVHGMMVSQIQLPVDSPITHLSWNCEKFKMEESEEGELWSGARRPLALAVAFKNGLIYLMRNFDDLAPAHAYTGMQGLFIEWSNSGEYLAVAGTRPVEVMNQSGVRNHEYFNSLHFYSPNGTRICNVTITATESPVTALCFGHNDKRIFVATGKQIHIGWVSKRIASLQLLCRLMIYKSLSTETCVAHLPLPLPVRALISSLHTQTIISNLPSAQELRDFSIHPQPNNQRLYCTMVRHDEDVTQSPGTVYTLYIEYLGGLVPILKGKRISKLRPEFIIYDPEMTQVSLGSTPDPTEDLVMVSSSSRPGTPRLDSRKWRCVDSKGKPLKPKLISESSDSDDVELCASPRMQRKRHRNRLRERAREQEREREEDWERNRNGLLPRPEHQLTYNDTLPEALKIAEITSNIWGTKFKIRGLVPFLPGNLGHVTYRTSVLHLQPRQMTIRLTELRDENDIFFYAADPFFQDEDEEDFVVMGGSSDAFSFTHPSDYYYTPPAAIRCILQSNPLAQLTPSPPNSPQLSTRENGRNPPEPCSSYQTSSTPFPCQVCEAGLSGSSRVNTSDILRHNSFQRLKGSLLVTARAHIERIDENGPTLNSPLSSHSLNRTSGSIRSPTRRCWTTTAGGSASSSSNQSNPPADSPAGPMAPVPVTAPTHVRRSMSASYLDSVEADHQLPVPLDVVGDEPGTASPPRRLILVANNGGAGGCHRKKPLKETLGKSKSWDSYDLHWWKTGGLAGGNCRELLRACPKCSFPTTTTTTAAPPLTSSSFRKTEKKGVDNRQAGTEDQIEKVSDPESPKRIPAMESAGSSNEILQPPPAPTHRRSISLLTPLLRRREKSRNRAAGVGGSSSAEERNPGTTDSLIPPASPQHTRKNGPSTPQPPRKSYLASASSPLRQLFANSPFLSRRKNREKGNSKMGPAVPPTYVDSSEDEESSDSPNFPPASPATFTPRASVPTVGSCRDYEIFHKNLLRPKLGKKKIHDIEPNPVVPRRREFVMSNKAPMWNENSQVYQLDFGGRVTQESAKNFQIEFRGKQVMQFGRIDGNAYTLDFQYPFSALQAFAVALANVTQRLK